MSDDLPPLPEPEDVAPFNHMRVYAFTGNQMHAYARQCIEQHEAQISASDDPTLLDLLWQARSALGLATAICDAVPNRDPGHLGKLVNAQPDGTHGYRKIKDAEATLSAYLTDLSAGLHEQKLEMLAVAGARDQGRQISARSLPEFEQMVEHCQFAADASQDYYHPREEVNAAAALLSAIKALHARAEKAEKEAERLTNACKSYEIQANRDALENAALRQDAERLDYIEKNARYDPKIDGQHVYWPTTLNKALRGPNLRAAIDAAMQEAKT
jgi:hypothetical protein